MWGGSPSYKSFRPQCQPPSIISHFLWSVSKKHSDSCRLEWIERSVLQLLLLEQKEVELLYYKKYHAIFSGLKYCPFEESYFNCQQLQPGRGDTETVATRLHEKLRRWFPVNSLWSGFCGDLHLDCMLHHFTSFHIARVVSQWKLRRRVLTRTRTQVSRMTTENSTTELWVTILLGYLVVMSRHHLF